MPGRVARRGSARPVRAPRSAPPRLPVNWRVFVAAATLLVSPSAWATEAPEHADAVIGGVVAWVASRLGRFYILTAALVILVADSRHGTIKMGPDHAKPQFNLFTGWAM